MRQLYGGLGGYEAKTMALDPTAPFVSSNSEQSVVPVMTTQELLSELAGYEAADFDLSPQATQAATHVSADRRELESATRYCFQTVL